MVLKDKVTIITGASRGIGYEVARAFLKEGALVALCGSRLASAEKATEKLLGEFPAAQILPLGVDVSDTESVNAMVDATLQKWGRVDVLINNAGITSAKSVLEMTDEDFDSVIRINLAGAFKCIRAAARVMQQNGGAIINRFGLP